MSNAVAHEEDEYEVDENKLMELHDAKKDRLGRSNLPALLERVDAQHKQNEKDSLGKSRKASRRASSAVLKASVDDQVARTTLNVPDDRAISLSRDIAMESLKTVGKHPMTGRHAYLEMNISDMNIILIDEIVQFPYIMSLDASRNVLESLAPLSDLLALTQLDASHNLIKECLDFAPRRCTREDAWSEGGRAIGSMLKYANLSFNSIQDLNHVQKHRFLECLLVSNNAISSIDPIAPLKYLMVLDLSHNRIESLPLLEDMKIQELNLKGNMLRSLENIQSLTLLTSLDVSNNELCTVEPLQHCPQLSYLDVSGNKIPDVQDLLLLKPCETLKTLWILNTPVASDPVHRLKLVFGLWSLSKLDFTEVSANERLKACNMHGSSKGDQSVREQALVKFLSGANVERFQTSLEP